MSDDYDIDERQCPKCCGDTRTQRCTEFDCDDGWISEDDGVNDWPAEKCPECHGRGFLWWCVRCGDCYVNEQHNGGAE